MSLDEFFPGGLPPRVYNMKNDTPPDDAVYVGRPSKWGNPFIVGRHGNRTEVIAMYETYMNEHPELCRDAMNELHGKSLVCWCAPKPCHADVLIRIANSPVDTEHKDVL